MPETQTPGQVNYEAYCRAMQGTVTDPMAKARGFNTTPNQAGAFTSRVTTAPSERRALRLLNGLRYKENHGAISPTPSCLPRGCLWWYRKCI